MRRKPQADNFKKISSWAATLFAPTLVGTICGMNFTYIPAELRRGFGYPFAIGLMGIVRVSLYLIFKRRDWLWARQRPLKPLYIARSVNNEVGALRLSGVAVSGDRLLVTNSQMDTFLYGDPLTTPVFTLESLPPHCPRTIGSVLCSRRGVPLRGTVGPVGLDAGRLSNPAALFRGVGRSGLICRQPAGLSGGGAS